MSGARLLRGRALLSVRGPAAFTSLAIYCGVWCVVCGVCCVLCGVCWVLCSVLVAGCWVLGFGCGLKYSLLCLADILCSTAKMSQELQHLQLLKRSHLQLMQSQVLDLDDLLQTDIDKEDQHCLGANQGKSKPSLPVHKPPKASTTPSWLGSMLKRPPAVRDIESRLKTEKSSHLESEKFPPRLTKKQVLKCLASSCLVAFLVMADQSGFPILIPSVSDDLNCHNIIHWAGTGSLVSGSIVNLVLSQLVAHLGKKTCFIVCLFISAIGEMGTALSSNGIMFNILKTFTGFGYGGLVSLAIIITSYVSPELERGKYHGVLGLCIGLGSCFGPFFNALFSGPSPNWKQSMFITGGVYMAIGCLCVSLLPSCLDNDTEQVQELEEKPHQITLKNFDYLGLFFFTTFITLLVVPLNMRNVSWSWKNVNIICPLIFSFISLILFIHFELKASIPLIQVSYLRQFKFSNLFVQTIFMSIIYSSMIYYFPYYFNIVRELDSIKIPSIMLSLLLPIATISFLGGYLISVFQSFHVFIITGYVIFNTGLILVLVFYNNLKNDIHSIMLLITMGCGFGLIFTPLTIGIQTLSTPKDQVDVFSIRSVAKTLGNSFGVIISSSIYTGCLKKNILSYSNDIIPLETKKLVLMNINKRTNLSFMFKTESLQSLENAYSDALFIVYASWLPISLIALVMGIFIYDPGLKRGNK